MLTKVFYIFVFLTYVLSQQVRIQFSGIPNQFAILWQSKDTNQSNIATVRFGYEENSLTEISHGETRSFRACLYYSSVTKEVLIRVRPNIDVFFQVSISPNSWSKLYKFRSSPETPRPFTFIAYADTDVTPDTKKVMDKILQEKSAEFVVIAGDLAYVKILFYILGLAMESRSMG